MKFLIVGTGQLSFEFQRFLSNKGIDFLVSSSSKSNGSFIKLDISSFENVRKVFDEYKFDAVINCGAYNFVDRAESDWKRSFEVNSFGPRNLAIFCGERNVALVHFSTDYVFDGSKETPYTIADIPRPLSKYGQSKLLGENFVREFSQRFILARVSWVFGIGNDLNFAKKILGWARSEERIRVAVDEVSVPTYTKDIVRSIMRLLEAGAWGLYHITNEGMCSRYEYANFILSSIGWRGELLEAYQRDFNLPAKRPKFSKLDNFGLKETVGVEMPFWQNSVKEFLSELGVL